MKLQPLQLWLPFFGGSIKRPEISRDATRAFELWQDELLVWMLPEISKPKRWRTQGIGNLAVPSEEFDRIYIVHVTEEGRVHAPVGKDILPATVDGLLDAWLNVQKVGGVSFVYPPEEVALEAPYIDPSENILARKRTFTFGPGTYMPVSSLSREAHEVTMIWPPEGSPSPVSPEAESAQQFPSKKLESDPPTVITDQGDVALHVFLRWPGRLESTMPLLSGPDDIFAQAQMCKLARQSASDLQGALRAATIDAQPYLFRGHSTVEHAWFRPTLEQRGVKHVLSKAEDHGLTVPPQSRHRWDENALNEALEQDVWQKWLAQPVPIRRAWGAVGLLWILLLDRLEAQLGFVPCERCGRIVSGKQGKRFCSKSDDSECFRRRRAIDQRRSRHGHRVCAQAK